MPPRAKCLWVQAARQKKPQIFPVLLGTHRWMIIKKSFALPYSPLGMGQCPSSARCEGFKSNSTFINEKAIGWGRQQGVTFLFHPFHVHQLLHVVGVIQPQLHPDKGLPPLQTELVPGLWAS